MEKTLLLYHTSFQQIKAPDIYYGRKNADFGQGFYLTDNEEFARRWAKLRSHQSTYINTYTLALSGLEVVRFTRDRQWFDYIFKNRAGFEDSLTADVIIGPIANDTIYDTYGVMTSGMLAADEALHLLSLGPQYQQIVIKTERALSALKWLSADLVIPDEVAAYQKQVREEEAAYQAAFLQELKGKPELAYILDLLS